MRDLAENSTLPESRFSAKSADVDATMRPGLFRKHARRFRYPVAWRPLNRVHLLQTRWRAASVVPRFGRRQIVQSRQDGMLATWFLGFWLLPLFAQAQPEAVP